MVFTAASGRCSTAFLGGQIHGDHRGNVNHYQSAGLSRKPAMTLASTCLGMLDAANMEIALTQIAKRRTP
jgi:hypothetical protein